MRFLLCLLLALALCGCSQTPAEKETGPTGKLIPRQNVGMLVFKDADTCRRADVLANQSPTLQNSYEFKAVSRSDKAVEILSDTSFRLLSRTEKFSHLRLTSGPYDGLEVWCPNEDALLDVLTIPAK